MELITVEHWDDFNSRLHGRRQREHPLQRIRTYFNSRLHGRRLLPGSPAQANCTFQLTPSRKATAVLHCLRKNCRHFNSRLHGRRRGLADQGLEPGTFQLTPSRKATYLGLFYCHFLRYFNSRLHGRRLQIQIIFAAKHFLFLLILSKFLILAFLFHLASLRFSLHPVIFPVRISLYFSVYLPFALETCTLCHNI